MKKGKKKISVEGRGTISDKGKDKGNSNNNK